MMHDHVFQTHEGWWCRVDGREFGCWSSRGEALAGMADEQQRAAARKAERQDRVPLDGNGEEE